jgi:hypothetical protein
MIEIQMYMEKERKRMNLVETIKNLQKDVWSYKYNNEILMKSKEQQEDFNIKLMHSLDGIETKVDKENDSRKLGSHRSRDERGRKISVGIHHHHSIWNSNRRAHSS